ncbi:helix-turn-helix domain-containing protein [Streptomyces sp. NBC_01669]|uniref:helix-turn-helix domain-containing protein n=1 Tax=Streptomyces sp. NBC_01669 TaxID=2975909 RepID=UPI00338E4049
MNLRSASAFTASTEDRSGGADADACDDVHPGPAFGSRPDACHRRCRAQRFSSDPGSAIFRRAIHCRRIHQTVRLEAVRRELEDAGSAHSTISEIAARWGFQDSAHFARLIRETYGLSASQLRSQTATEQSTR